MLVSKSHLIKPTGIVTCLNLMQKRIFFKSNKFEFHKTNVVKIKKIDEHVHKIFKSCFGSKKQLNTSNKIMPIFHLKKFKLILKYFLCSFLVCIL